VLLAVAALCYPRPSPIERCFRQQGFDAPRGVPSDDVPDGVIWPLMGVQAVASMCCLYLVGLAFGRGFFAPAGYALLISVVGNLVPHIVAQPFRAVVVVASTLIQAVFLSIVAAQWLPAAAGASPSSQLIAAIPLATLVLSTARIPWCPSYQLVVAWSVLILAGTAATASSAFFVTAAVVALVAAFSVYLALHLPMRETAPAGESDISREDSQDQIHSLRVSFHESFFFSRVNEIIRGLFTVSLATAIVGSAFSAGVAGWMPFLVLWGLFLLPPAAGLSRCSLSVFASGAAVGIVLWGVAIAFELGTSHEYVVITAVGLVILLSSLPYRIEELIPMYGGVIVIVTGVAEHSAQPQLIAVLSFAGLWLAVVLCSFVVRAARERHLLSSLPSALRESYSLADTLRVTAAALGELFSTPAFAVDCAAARIERVDFDEVRELVPTDFPVLQQLLEEQTDQTMSRWSHRFGAFD
ncbi:MAG: hypothetical protein KDD44_12430, partial [Bdellovibrionales bacterium]|nr:hypothetical protein [Bdellovibrionales bacterium]